MLRSLLKAKAYQQTNKKKRQQKPHFNDPDFIQIFMTFPEKHREKQAHTQLDSIESHHNSSPAPFHPKIKCLNALLCSRTSKARAGCGG